MHQLSKIFLIVIVVLIITLGYLYFNTRQVAEDNFDELLKTSEQYSKQIDGLDNGNDKVKSGRIYRIEESQIYFTNIENENGSLQIDDINLMNGRTEEELKLEDIQENDFIEIQTWRDNRVCVYKNINGEELKKELLISLSLPSSNLMVVGIKEIKRLENNEAIVTIMVNDFVDPRYYGVEDNSFEIDVKFTANTVYNSRGNNIYDVNTLEYAIGNINDLRLDTRTLNNQYPEVLEFNSTDT